MILRMVVIPRCPFQIFQACQGFGFIDMGGQTLFVHFSECEVGKQPKEGDILTFQYEPRRLWVVCAGKGKFWKGIQNFIGASVGNCWLRLTSNRFLLYSHIFTISAAGRD